MVGHDSAYVNRMFGGFHFHLPASTDKVTFQPKAESDISTSGEKTNAPKPEPQTAMAVANARFRLK